MVKACRKAAKNIIRDFGEVEKLQVSLKGPGNFVTESDKKVEKILIEELQKARPSYSILSEEIGKITNDDEFSAIKLITFFVFRDEIEMDDISTNFQSSSKVNESFSKIRAIFSGYLFAEFFKKSIICCLIFF